MVRRVSKPRQQILRGGSKKDFSQTVGSFYFESLALSVSTHIKLTMACISVLWKIQIQRLEEPNVDWMSGLVQSFQSSLC